MSPATDTVWTDCTDLDGHVFRSTHSIPFGRRWEFISESFAEQFNCDPDDVGCAETDDGDRITVHGEIVGSAVTRVVASVVRASERRAA